MTDNAANVTPSAPPPKRKRNTGLLVLITIIVVLLTAETALVVASFVSPTSVKSLTTRADDLRKAWMGEDGQPGIPQRAMDGLNNFYRDNVVTLWSQPKPDPLATTFAKCATCHPDYETKARFTHVYMDHAVHAQTGLTCAKCHTMIQHPGPDRPAEATCAKCHDQVTQKGQCDFCHPPGTLPHFYLMGAPRNQFINCATCHPNNTIPQLGRTLVEVGEFSGNPDTLCLKCHSVVAPTAGSSPSPFASPAPWSSPSPATGPWPTDIPQWCQRCHGQDLPDPHVADWYVLHRQVALTDGGSCTNCHNQTWCAMKCHAVTSFGPPAPLPLPTPSPITPPSQPNPTPSEVRSP